jgi:hypothetical protein
MLKIFKHPVCAALALALALPTGAAQATADPADAAMEFIRPEAIRAHMNFLADDLLEGSGTNSHGYEIAARYMATEFESMGLAPAGEAGTDLSSCSIQGIRPPRPRA